MQISKIKIQNDNEKLKNILTGIFDI